MRMYTKTLRTGLFEGGDILENAALMVLGHGEGFKQKFIDYYSERQIGLETWGLFRQRVNTTFELLLPTYNNLYLSETLVKNPLLTKFYRDKNHHYGGNRSKRVGTADGQSLSRSQGQQAGYDDSFASHEDLGLFNQNDSTQNVQKNIGASKNDNTSKKDQRAYDINLKNSIDATQNVQQTKTANKTKGALDEKTNTTTLYSDTPQNQIFTSVSKLWNEGYLTTAQEVNQTHTQNTTGTGATGQTSYGGTKGFNTTGWEEARKAGEVFYSNGGDATASTTYGGTKLFKQNSQETLGRVSSFDRNASNSAAKQNTKVLSNFLNADITMDEALDYYTVQGFDGRSVSSLLLEFRETFINVDYRFIKEFERFFLGVF